MLTIFKTPLSYLASNNILSETNCHTEEYHRYDICDQDRFQPFNSLEFKLLRATVSVSASDPPSKDVNAWFTTVSLKPLSYIIMWKILSFLDLKVFNSENSYLFSCNINEQFTLVVRTKRKKSFFQNYKNGYLIHS